MASGVYNSFKAELMNKVVDLEGDVIKVALMNNSHSFTAENDGWANVSANEVSGTGYTAGGQALASKAVTTDDTDDEGVWDAANTTWDSSTITAYHAVIYDDSVTTPIADQLICSIDFGGAQSSSNGDFTIQWAAEGIINIT
jgi:hypothetical protein